MYTCGVAEDDCSLPDVVGLCGTKKMALAEIAKALENWGW